MKKLLDNSDLGIPYTTVLNRMTVKMARSLLGINKLNRLYAGAEGRTGVDFARAILEQLGVNVMTDAGRLDFIPRKGAFVLVANHPHGALDGLILLALVASVRPDVKILGNFLLTQVEPLSDFFLSVDAFDTKGGRTLASVRRVVEHLKGGAPLIVFPAGEVATFRKGLSKVEDAAWSPSIAKLILQAGVPVVPAYIDGRNSLMFHLLGKMHRMLRTARLPLELTNKKGRTVSVAFGSAVSVRLLREVGEPEAVSDFLRANVYCLYPVLAADEAAASEGEGEVLDKGHTKRVRPEARRKKKTQDRAVGGRKEVENEAFPVDPGLLERELEAVSAERLLIRIGDLCLFCAPTYAIPLTMREILRLRKETARTPREAKSPDMENEEYDGLYDCLFVWDAAARTITGAYQIGYGDALLDGLGFEGFYAYSMFEFSRHLNDVLRQSIEVGYSFVVGDARRRSQTLLLLWRGILQVLLRNPAYRYLMGPVSMPGGYAMAAKWLLVDYIRANHWNGELARYVVARSGIGALGRPAAMDEELIRGVSSAEEIDKLIRDVEPSGQGMPVMMKKYLQLGGRVMGFHIDPMLDNALDVMLVLDLCDVPADKIDLVAREFPDIDVRERFRMTGNTNL